MHSEPATQYMMYVGGSKWVCAECGNDPESHKCTHYLNRVSSKLNYLRLMCDYLDEKYLEYHVTQIPQYDDGTPRRRKKKKHKGRQFIFKRITARMLREVVVPGLTDIAKPLRMKVKLGQYVPNNNALLRMVKVRVFL